MRFFLLAAVLASAPAAALQYYPRAAVSASAPLAAPLAGTLPARMRLALATAAADPLRAEALLHRGLLLLRNQAPDAETHALVQALSVYAAQAYSDSVDPDHGRGRLVPVFAIAAAARGTLRAWTLNEQHADWLSARAWPQDPADQAALVRRLPPAQLAELPQPLSAAALIALLERQPNLAAYQQLLQYRAPDADMLRALAKIPGHLSAESAFALLSEAAQRPGLAAGALSALGELSPRWPPAQALLLARLDDPRSGGAAAQALATDVSALPELRRLALGEPDGRRLRRALLALSLARTPEAQAVLRRVAADAGRPAELREELARSLP